MGDVFPEPKRNWGKKLFNLFLVVAVGYGAYYAYTTGELLNILNWLLSQDILLLTIIAVIGLIVLAAMVGG
jgi:hypothetical protein